MSSPKYEQFGMSERDMNDIFEPMRKKFKMSKNQATYGVWADSDDDDDEEGGQRNKHGARKRKNQRSDYSAPIEFVSGGVKIGDKITKEETSLTDEIINLIDYSSSEDEDEEGRHKQVRKQQVWKVSKGTSHTNVSFTTKKNDKIGNWEKHTKGIGQKLLEKMGHVAGKGLGKNLQGRVNPVEATQREGKGAVGLYGPETKEKQSHEEILIEEVEETETQFKRWKKSEKDKIPAKNEIPFDEVMKNLSRKQKKTSHSSNLDASNVPIIDMRGRQQRILSGYHAINTKQYKIDEHDSNSVKTQERLFDLPELLNNLELLCDMTGEQLVKTHKKIESQEDALVNIDYEMKKAYKVYKEEEEQIKKMEDLVDILDRCRQACKELGIDGALEECSELLQIIKTQFQEEFVMYDLLTEITNIVIPSLEKEFQDWDPLQNSGQGTRVMTFLKDFLSDQTNDSYNSFDTRGLFDEITWKILMPKIGVAVDSWNARQTHTMIDIIELWQPILPGWMMTIFMEQYIFPKVKKELDVWEPHRDPIPVQTWAQPWALIIPSRKSILYATIREKLSKIFAFWEPHDPTGKVMIGAWVGLFEQSDMIAFLASCVLPKLLLCLQSIYFILRGQNYKQFSYVMEWVGIMPHQYMVDALLERFFPGLYVSLFNWTNSKCCEKAELNHWFTTWMSCFPDKLKTDPEIQKSLSSAVMIINHGGSIPPPISHVPHYYTQLPVQTSSLPKPSDHQNIGQVKVQFERFCRQNKVTLESMSGANQNKEQIYKIGNLLIRFDNEFVYSFENLKWIPAKSFEQLLQKSKLMKP